MKLRIALFILSVAVMAALGLFTQARSESVTPITVDTIGVVLPTGEIVPTTGTYAVSPCPETKKLEPAAEDDGSYFTHKHWHHE